MLNKLFCFARKYKVQSIFASSACAAANLKRTYYATLIGAFISLIHIILFVVSPEGESSNMVFWRNGIITSHFSLLMLFMFTFLTARYMRKKNLAGTPLYVLQYAVIGVVMSAGVVIVSIDQLVTSNITPFIVVCLIMGTVFLVEPIYAFIIYSASYVAYYFAIAVASQHAEQLLSNRVNGITAIGIGFALSVIMWRLNLTNLKQKKRIAVQQQQLEKANKKLERMAYFDSLTGLPNRRHFDEVLQKELSLIERKGHESCLVMIDVDDFKGINDVHGHPVGDCFLAQLGNLLAQSIRKYDTLCRLGGDEFIALLPQTTLSEATAFAGSLRERMIPYSFKIESVTIRATASIGVARLEGSRNDTLIKHYADVDKALYQAKQSGRNCVRCA